MKVGREGVNLESFRRRYRKAGRAEKGRILDELCDLHGYSRKYLIQFFNYLTYRQHVRRGRKAQYTGDELLEPLKRLWMATDQMCGKRLKAAIVLWLPSYEETYGCLSVMQRTWLLKISPATLDRVLKPYRSQHKRRGLPGTRPGYLLKTHIPIKTDNWDVAQPGFLEADTVAHGGDSTAGEHVWSITFTDILTCWTEIRAIWNKGAEEVVAKIKDIEKILPFSLKGFDCDNGSEFLNWHLLRYFSEDRKQPIQFTRSRPYKKNDNAHVEQKNWTHVRHLFGYDRFDDPRLVDLMNDLYENEWSLYQNHFMPTQKLLEKVKINSKYRRKYSKAKTAYERLLESPDVDGEIKMKKAILHQTLNPFELKKMIEAKLKKIFKYVKAHPKPRTQI